MDGASAEGASAEGISAEGASAIEETLPPAVLAVRAWERARVARGRGAASGIAWSPGAPSAVELWSAGAVRRRGGGVTASVTDP